MISRLEKKNSKIQSNIDSIKPQIRNLENLSDPEFEMEVEEIAGLMPGILSQDEKNRAIRILGEANNKNQLNHR